VKLSLLGTEVHSAYCRHDESDDSFVHAVLVAAPRYHHLHSYMQIENCRCMCHWLGKDCYADSDELLCCVLNWAVLWVLNLPCHTAGSITDCICSLLKILST